MENINLTAEESYTDDDLRYLRKIFQNPYLTKKPVEIKRKGECYD